METVHTLSVTLLLIGTGSLVAAIVIAIITYERRKKAVLRMRQMLEAAIDGTFTEDTYD